jgi:hypothetical protein
VCAQTELIEDEFVQIGLWLGRGRVFAAGHEGEPFQQTEAREVRLDPRVFRVGSDGDRQAGGARFVEERDDAGQRRELLEATFFSVLALGLELGVDRAWTKGGPRIEFEINVPHRADKQRFVEGHAARRVNIRVRTDERGLGVEDQAVEIKNERAKHGGEFG